MKLRSWWILSALLIGGSVYAAQDTAAPAHEAATALIKAPRTVRTRPPRKPRRQRRTQQRPPSWLRKALNKLSVRRHRRRLKRPNGRLIRPTRRQNGPNIRLPKQP